MNPQKFVRRNTKVILGFIVAVMAITMVVSFSTTVPTTDHDSKAPRGKLYMQRIVTEGEFRAASQFARIYHAWSWLNTGYNLQLYSYYRSAMPTLEEKDLEEETKKYLVLLEAAKDHEIFVTEEEMSDRVSQFFRSLRGFRQEQYPNLVRAMFRTTVAGFERAMVPITRIDKLLELFVESDFEDFEKVYAESLQENRSARVRVAGFDPVLFARYLQPVRPDEVLAFYKENEKLFEVPEKIQVEYAMTNWEDYKDRIEEITEEDMKKYHEENQRRYPKESTEPSAAPRRGPGAPPEPPAQEWKTFEEARIQVYDDLLQERAMKLAREVARKIDTEIGEKLAEIEAGTLKPEDLKLEPIVEAYRAKGHKVKHGVTTNFDRDHIDDVEKAENLGDTKGKLRDWAFDGAALQYEISPGLMESDAGYIICQLRNRKGAYSPGLTRGIEERIQRELKRRQLQQRAEKEARRIQTLIQEKGFAEVQRTTGISFETSNYFQLKDRASVGLSDSAWDQPIRSQIRPYVMADPPDVGRTLIVSGEQLSRGPGPGASSPAGEKYWSYLVYLDDVLPETNIDASQDFANAYRGQLQTYRDARRARVAQRIFESEGAWEDLKEEKESDKPKQAGP